MNAEKHFKLCDCPPKYNMEETPCSRDLSDKLTVAQEVKSPNFKEQNKLRGFSPQANYTDRATAASQRS
jgi:hypothetical protein